MSQPPMGSSTPPALEFSVALEPSHLLRARERLRDYLRLHCADEEFVDDVVLCLEEACTNAIRHSGSAGAMKIAAHFDGDRLVCGVSDTGNGFDIDSFDPTRVPDPLATGGRGLFVISQIMDEMKLRVDGGLEVRMVKKVTPNCERPPLESGLGELSDLAAAGPDDARTMAMLEELDEAFFALDWEYRYVHVNGEAERLIRKQREELLGRTPWEVLPQLQGSLLAERYREAMELGRPSVFEHRSIVSGEWLEVRVYPTRAGISAYYRGIDERKHVELEVEATRAQLASTLAAITDGFYTLDRLWTVTYLNEQAAAVFPKGMAALGTSFWELFPEAMGSEFEINKRRAMELGELRSFESYYPPMDAWFEERDYPSDDGITVLFTDISERKRNDAQRQALLEASEAQSKELRAQRLELQEQYEQLHAQRDKLKERAERVTLLKELAEIGASSFSEQETGRRQIDALMSALGAKTAFLFTADRDGRRLVPLALAGVPDEYLDEHFGPVDVDGPGLSAHVFSSGRPAFVRDSGSDTTMSPEGRAFTLALGERSGASLPLHVREQTIGVLSLAWEQPRDLDPDEVAFLTSVAVEVALGLANASLLARQQNQSELLRAQAAELRASRDSVTRRAGLAEALNSIDSKVHSTLEPDEILQSALEESVAALSLDAGAIEMREASAWVVRYQHGFSETDVGQQLTEAEAPNAMRAALTAEPFAIPDMRDEPVTNVGFVRAHSLRSVIVAPLIVRASVVGCLLLYGRSPRSFHESEIDFARKVAATVSLAVENAKLFEAETDARRRMQQELETTSLLLDAAMALTTWGDLGGMLQSLGDLLLRATRRSRVVLELWDEDRREVEIAVSTGSAAIPRGRFAYDAISEATQAAIAGRRTSVIDYAQTGAPKPMKTYLDDHGFQLLLCVPIVYRERLVGLIMVDEPGERWPFTPRELALVEAIAAEAGAAIENARLLQREAESARLSVALNEINNLIHSTLDADAIMQRVVEEAATAVGADSVIIALKQGDDWVAEYGYPEVSGLIHQSVRTDEAPFMVAAVTERRPVAIEDCATDPRCLPDVQARFDVRSVMCIPLIVRDEVLGVVFFNHHAEPVRFEPRTVEFAGRLATAISSALGNAQLYAAQRSIAGTLQENFVHPLPKLAGLDLGFVSQTAFEPDLVGGDFSDVFEVGDGRVVVLIGDVAGKGVKAAGLTETVRSMVRAFASVDPSPAYILTKTNEVLLAVDTEEPHVTAFLVVLDPQTGHASYASAGHPAAVHVSPYSCAALQPALLPPLRGFATEYVNEHVRLSLDDYLLFYTDGVTEARHGDKEFGEQRLCETAARLRGSSAQEVAEGVRDAAAKFAGTLRDDLHVVCLRLA